jgi:hypothetical protein
MCWCQKQCAISDGRKRRSWCRSTASDPSNRTLIIRSALGLNIGSGADIEFVKESEGMVTALLLQGDVRAVRRQQ